MRKTIKVCLLTIIGVLLAPLAFAQFRAPVNGRITLGTSAVAFPALQVYNCTFQAPSTNVGPIYLGGSTVTNAGGANRGAALVAGAALNNISLKNLNWMYGAADNANDLVVYLCN